MGLVLAFALCPCVLGSCVSSCVACLVYWVLAFVLMLRGLPLMALYWGLPLPLSIGYILLNVCGYAVNRVLYWLLVALSFYDNAIDSGATGTQGKRQSVPPEGDRQSRQPGEGVA